MTVDNGGVFLADFDALGLAEFSDGRLLERHAGFFGDHRAARQDGDVFEHGFATIAKTRCLDGGGLEDTADVVDDQRGQGLAFDVFSHDQQRTAGLGNLLEHGKQVTDVADLLVVDQDERIFENGDLLLGVVDEVGREVAAIELHALDDVEFIFE